MNEHLSKNLLARAADRGDLDPAEARRANAHLASCRACRREVSVYAALFKDLDRIPVPEPPSRFDMRVLRSLPGRSERAALWRFATRAYGLTSVALAAVVGAAVFILGPSGSTSVVASGLSAFLAAILDGFRSVLSGTVGLLKALGGLFPIADAGSALVRGLETAALALGPQALVVTALTMTLASLVLYWAMSTARERGVPHVSLSL